MIILYTYKDGCNAVENKGATIYHLLGATLRISLEDDA
jgi:hypothetical protein